MSGFFFLTQDIPFFLPSKIKSSPSSLGEEVEVPAPKRRKEGREEARQEIIAKPAVWSHMGKEGVMGEGKGGV